MNIYIYGAGKNGNDVLKLIKECYSNLFSINCFLDSNKTGTIDDIPIHKIDEVDLYYSTVIIALFDFKEATKTFLELKQRGVKNIWWFKNSKKAFGKNFFNEQCISCEKWQEYMLEHVEMHIMDACNLNCRGCTHFSPIFKKEIPDLNSRISDLKKLLNKDVHIVQFNLLGGEPFLNPEINKYIVECRRILQYSEIVIVTNGLLIPELKDNILKCIKENNIKVSVSEYLPTHKMIQKIEERLDSYSIIYNIRAYDTKEKFNKPLHLNADGKYKHLCISDGCVNIWNGRIARCPTLMYIDSFNRKFMTNLPSEGILSLDDCPNGKQLIETLEKKVPLCDYCIENNIDWSVCGKEVSLDDFAVET